MRLRLACAVVLITQLFSASAPSADFKKTRVDVTDLSHEVAALQVIYQLELTPRQLQALAKLAKGTAAPGERKPIRGSERLRGLLIDLRTALRKHDDSKIDDLTDKVDELKERDRSDDDSVKMTEAARKA